MLHQQRWISSGALASLLAKESLGEDGLAVGMFMGLKVITLLRDNPIIVQGLGFTGFIKSFQSCLGD